jgi:hypothetical protein
LRARLQEGVRVCQLLDGHQRAGSGVLGSCCMIPAAPMIPSVVCSRFMASQVGAPHSIYRMPGLSVKFELEVLAGAYKIRVYASRPPGEVEADEIRQLVLSIMQHHRLVGVFDTR